MKLSTSLEELLNTIEKLQSEVIELREQAEILEKKNNQLSQHIQKGDQSSSLGNLLKLYEQGFHICNGSFGQSRDEDCIFCLNVIGRAHEE